MTQRRAGLQENTQGWVLQGCCSWLFLVIAGCCSWLVCCLVVAGCIEFQKGLHGGGFVDLEGERVGERGVGVKGQQLGRLGVCVRENVYHL